MLMTLTFRSWLLKQVSVVQVPPGGLEVFNFNLNRNAHIDIGAQWKQSGSGGETRINFSLVQDDCVAGKVAEQIGSGGTYRRRRMGRHLNTIARPEMAA